MSRIAIISAASLLILPAAAGAKSHPPVAKSAAARTVNVQRPVNGTGVYTASVTISRPAKGTNRVQLLVENSRRRTIRVRRSRSSKKLTVKIDVGVNDGALNLSAIGQETKPRLKVALRRKGGSTTPAPTPSPTPTPTPTTMHSPTLPSPTKLVWSDDFTGSANSAPSSANWTMDTGGHGWGNNELQSFTSRRENVALDGTGDLSITARKEQYTGADGYKRDYTSGRLHTKGKFSMTYGRMEARVRVPAGRGLWSCIWMMGDDIWTAGWPTAGEMDILEVLGQDTRTGYGSLHGPMGTTQQAWGKSNPFTMANPLSDSYHDFGIIWNSNSVEWTVDGMAYARTDRSDLPAGARWVFDHGFHPILSLAVGGSWPGSPDASTQFPATMSVDWVRAYQ